MKRIDKSFLGWISKQPDVERLKDKPTEKLGYVSEGGIAGAAKYEKELQKIPIEQAKDEVTRKHPEIYLQRIMLF